MRMECPYCWQHYEISHTDRDKDFVCINCDQSFNGRDATIIPGNHQKLWMIVSFAAGALALLMLATNVFLWRQMKYYGNHLSALMTLEAGRPLETAPAAPAAPAETAPDTVAAAAAEKTAATAAKLTELAERIAALEEALKKQEERNTVLDRKIAAVVKGLADGRAQLRAINPETRLGELEKAVYLLEQQQKTVAAK